MTNRSQSGAGWRDSVWNRARPMGNGGTGLALTGRRSPQTGSEPRRVRNADGDASVVRFLTAPWMAPAQRRYRTGNRQLMRLLEWVTARTWPLAVMDDICGWFEEGSAGSRVFLGCVAGAVIAALLSLQWASLYRLQSLTWLPVFCGHGFLVLVTGSFLLGVTILPVIVGHVLGVLLRFYVLLNLCSMAALVGYGGWLLLHAKP